MPRQHGHMKTKATLALVVVLVFAILAVAALASKPIKGASYSGVTPHAGTITVKIAKNGRTASVNVERVPAFCQGGSGSVKQKSKPASISKTGSVTMTIAYSATNASKPFAHVVVKGGFYTFSGAKVFDGTVKSTFVAAASKECDGQESFQATLLLGR